jgi:hypothetical protein
MKDGCTRHQEIYGIPPLNLNEATCCYLFIQKAICYDHLLASIQSYISKEWLTLEAFLESLRQKH